MRVRFATIAVLLFTLVARAGYAADMNAWLDRSRIAEGETVRLTLEAQGQESGRPDTGPLEQDFEVLGLATGSRLNIVNGRTDARTTWTLTLSPRHSGTLTIPALRVGNHSSEPLTLDVSQTPVQAVDSGADVLLEREIEPDTPYVQQQLLYTVRLLYAVPVTGGRLSEPEPKDTLVQRLGEDREYATTRNGRRYQVIERRYALFPQTSGSLEVNAPVFDGEVPDKSRRRSSPFKRFFGNDSLLGNDPFDDLLTPTRRLRVRGEPATIEVRPRPAAAHGAHWLPAAGLQLKGEWQPADGQVKAGEPVTLTIDLQVQGLTGGQLPGVAPEAVDGFKVYPDRAQRETGDGGKGVTGHLLQKVAFIPERTGELKLPDIELHWWDTGADSERVATLPGRALTVAAAAGRSGTDSQATAASLATADDKATGPEVSTPVPNAPATGQQFPATTFPGPWPWVSAVLAAGWLLSMLLWWWRARGIRAAGQAKHAVSNAPATGPSRKQFLAACRASDAAGAHSALLAWAAAHWPDDPPRGLEGLSQRLNDPEVRAALAELNRVRYTGADQWNGERLAQHLQRLPEPGSRVERGGAVLAPLYPGATH